MADRRRKTGNVRRPG